MIDWLLRHPALLAAAWILVTCYTWGWLLAGTGANWFAILFFGFAWGWLSVELIYRGCDRARSDRLP